MLGSPGRVISARPLATVIDLEDLSRTEMPGGGPSSTNPRTDSVPSPWQHTPSQGGTVPPVGGSDLSTSPRASISLHASTESTISPVACTITESPAETGEVPLMCRKRTVSHPNAV